MLALGAYAKHFHSAVQHMLSSSLRDFKITRIQQEYIIFYSELIICCFVYHNLKCYPLLICNKQKKLWLQVIRIGFPLQFSGIMNTQTRNAICYLNQKLHEVLIINNYKSFFFFFFPFLFFFFFLIFFLSQYASGEWNKS